MNKQQLQLIKDNPNLSGAAIARLLGVHKSTVERNREKPLWKHSGVGIPYIYESVNKDGVYKSLKFAGRALAKGKIESVLVNLDRLIHCLENNNGKLPMTTEESIFSNLTLLRRVRNDVTKRYGTGTSSSETSIVPWPNAIKRCD